MKKKKFKQKRIEFIDEEIKELEGDLSFDQIKNRQWWECRYSSFRTSKRFTLKDYVLSSKNEVMRISGKKGGAYYKGKIMKRRINNGGYWAFLLSSNEGEKVIFLHRLKWESRNDWIPRGMQINHLNGNKRKNKFSNLEIVTSGENNKHAIETGLRRVPKGKDHYLYGKHPSRKTLEKMRKRMTGKGNPMYGKHFSSEVCKKIGDSQRGEKSRLFGKRGENCINSKLTVSKVEKILFSRYRDSFSYDDLIKLYGFSRSTIIRVVNGFFWNPENLTKEELREKYGN